jgi:diguanylate cyclase (GGDEF)-like protein
VLKLPPREADDTNALSRTLASPSAASIPAPTADEALHALTCAVAELALAEGLADIQAVVLPAARRLTGADGATLVLREDGQCLHADEEAIGPLWKGTRFPLESCISGWAMLNRKSAAVEDVFADPRIPHDAYRTTFVRSLAVVPIRTTDPIGAIGLYWAARHVASEREIGLARALADSTAVALQHVRVAERCDRAARDHARLSRDARERRVAEAGERELCETDPLTALPNRRHWDHAVAEALAPTEQPVCVALLEIDRLEAYADLHGHTAGDELLRRLAAVWRAGLRPGDLLARYGAEEFAIVLKRCDANTASMVAQRLRAVCGDGPTLSIGIAQWDGEEVAGSLVCRADEALYRAKRAGRDRVAF